MAGLLALSAIALSKLAWLEAHGIGALTLAIVLGMIIGNTAYAKVAAVSAQASISPNGPYFVPASCSSAYD
jgi:uncharacterized membrane protein YadS